MTDEHLTIFLSPRRIDPLEFSNTAGSVRWVYLGKLFHEKARLELDLGPSFECIDIARIHNDVADKIRVEFNVWMDGINRTNSSSFAWWMGPVSSRNVYRSDVFQFCCYTEILATLWNTQERRPMFIVVESPALAAALARWAASRGITVSAKGRYVAVLFRMKGYTAFFLRWANFIVTTCLRKGAALFHNVRSAIPTAEGEGLVIIHTYIHPASITEDGVFSDRYFPFLYEFLGKMGKSIAILPTYHGFRYNYVPLFSMMRKSRTWFIIPERYLTISDFLHAFCYPFHMLLGNYRSPDFRGNDYQAILKEDIILDNFEDSLDAILKYRLMARLVEKGVHPERLIDWYENQAINRALSAGFRRYFPGVPIIGAQFFLHYPNFLSLSPTISEIEAGIVPDRLLETSAYQCTKATAFAPTLDCRPSAALRYAHLFSPGSEAGAGVNSESLPVVLLLASFDLEETLELLSQIRQVLPEIGRKTRVLIKLHPDMNSRTLIAKIGPGAWPERVEIFSGTLPDAIQQASVVISKSSGSIVEAAANGIPVIFCGSQTKLNLNPLAGIDLPCISQCYTTAELKKAIQKYISMTEEEKVSYRDNGRYLRDLFFTEIREDTLAPFLE